MYYAFNMPYVNNNNNNNNNHKNEDTTNINIHDYVIRYYVVLENKISRNNVLTDKMMSII